MNKKKRMLFKIISLVILIVGFCITLTSYAVDIIDPDSVIDGIAFDTPDSGAEKVRTILGIIQVIGTIISLIAIIVIGIKYMIGSVEEKADYKKTMIPFIIGCAFILGISNIVPIIYNIISELN